MSNNFIEEMTDEEFFAYLTKLRNSTVNGFATEIGIEVVELKLGYARAELALSQMHANPIGSIHGGALFTLMDSVGGAAATTRRRKCTTLSASVNYVTAGIGAKKLVAEAIEVKAGKSTCIYTVNLMDETGRLLVTGNFTYFYLKGDFPALPEENTAK